VGHWGTCWTGQRCSGELEDMLDMVEGYWDTREHAEYDGREVGHWGTSWTRQRGSGTLGDMLNTAEG